jgi:hypothetical protein
MEEEKKLIEKYKYMLKDIMVKRGFLEAAENIHQIVRNCSARVIQDKMELWKAWDDKSQWPWYADKISRGNRHKEYEDDELRF